MGPGSPLAPLLERWNQLPRSRQMLLGGIALVAILGIYFVFMTSSSPRMVTAYTGLAPEDSALIVDELERQGIEYEVSAGGANVSVHAGKVAEARIALAQAGLPTAGGVGFEVFESTNFGATDFHNEVNFLRALQGELTRSINTLEPVRSSRVNIVLPKDALFAEDQKDTTASVVLQLRPGVRLTEEQVQGIVNLVSHSVEGLERSGITILQDTGSVLYDGATMDSPFSGGATLSQMEVARQYEAALQRDLNNVLAQVVGPGRSAVTVRAALNWDTVTETADTYAPVDEAVPRSSVTIEETFVGDNIGVGGVPGVGAGDDPAGAVGTSEYTRTETTVNNEINRVQTSTVRAPGQVDRLSVSLVLDESVTAAQEASLTSAIAAAVGLDQVRGDQLSVTRLPFDAGARDQFVTESSPAFDLATAMSAFRGLMLVLGVILAFVLSMLLLRTLSRRQMSIAPAQRPAYLTHAPAPAALGAPPEEPEELVPEVDPHEKRVHHLAEQNPQAVAEVVQTWMRED